MNNNRNDMSYLFFKWLSVGSTIVIVVGFLWLITKGIWSESPIGEADQAPAID